MEETGSSIRNGLEVAWMNVASFLPKAAMFLIILVAGYFLAKFLAKLFDRVLERVGFDRVVERGGIKRALSKTRYDASDLLSKILFYTVFLFVLQLAFGVFGSNPVSDLLTRVIAFLPSIFVAILIVVIASAVAKGVKDIVGSVLSGVPWGRFAANLASVAIITIGIFAALSHVGIAPAIVNGLFYAMLAIIVGSAVIAIGGGGIAPMRQRWENVLQKYDSEKPARQQQMSTAKDRVAQRAEARKQQVQSALNNPPQPR